MNREKWAKKFRALIDEAEKDGVDLYIDNECCGCSMMSLKVGLVDHEAYDDDPIIPGVGV